MTWNFVIIIGLANTSHEMPSLIFSEKINKIKKKIKILFASVKLSA